MTGKNLYRLRYWLLAAALLLLAAVPALGEVVDRIAAVVNDEIITTFELERELERRLAAAEVSPARREELRRQTLEELVEGALIRQRAEELGIKVGAEEVEAALQDVLKQNRLTLAQLEEALQAQGLGLPEYRDTLRRQILRFKLVGREVQGKVDVTSEEVREYYREHPEEFWEEPKLQLSRLTFPIPAKASPEQLAALRQSAQEARARLRQGEEFYAVLLSLAGKADGGDMGRFGAGELTSAFERAVQGLKEGEVSEVVETPQGLHLLQVTERRGGEARPFEAVEEAIRRLLLERKSQERFREWSEKLKQEAYLDIRL